MEYKLVPVEPTAEMIDAAIAAHEQIMHRRLTLGGLYRAELRAAIAAARPAEGGVMDEKAYCECGHPMESVRPGKHQPVGCCARIAELEAGEKRLREWSDYYRAQWLGAQAVPPVEPPPPAPEVQPGACLVERIAELEAERDELKSMLDWHVREPVPDGDPVQELGEYLADNLDEDKWNHVEPLLNGLRAALQEGKSDE